MSTNPVILDMLGDELKDAVIAAQARLSDETIIARCAAGLWLTEREGETIDEGLSYEACVTAVEALT